MNSGLLLTHFNRISEAPDAIPRLRRLVFKLAVRGKLVEKSPSDEPAYELLKRIQLEKDRLVKEGVIKRQVPLPPVDQHTLPFLVPKHWIWLQLSGIGLLSGGMTPSKNRPEFWNGDINWFSPKDIKSDELIESELKITSAGVVETGLQIYQPGCLFMVARSGILKRTFPVAINRVEASVNQDLKVLTPFIAGLDRYLQIMFRGMTDFILSELVKTGTTVQSLKYDEFEMQPLPLAPLHEQQRIVAKVDELMALCDRLESAQREREVRRDRLSSATVHHLNSGVSAESLRGYARFYLRHLPHLTTCPAHVRRLRQAILDLAVRGQIVRQNETDDDARNLLASIKDERKRRIEGGTVKQPGPLKTNGRETLFDFLIPSHWTFCFVDDFALKVTDGEHATPRRCQSGHYLLSARNVTNSGIDVSDVDFVPEEEFRRIRKRCDPDKGDILISCSGSVGRIAVVEKDDAYSMVRSAALIKLDARYTDPRYIAYALRATPAQEQIGLYSKSTAQANLFIGAIRKLRIPLPPFAEQQRIVSRVDELMALCAQLETQLTVSQGKRSGLLEAVLFNALNGASSVDPTQFSIRA